MLKAKKTVSTMLVLVFTIVLLCSTALAASKTFYNQPGYGTVSLSLTNNYNPDYFQAMTTVSQNPDVAYFYQTYDLRNSLGQQLAFSQHNSTRGIIGYGTIFDTSSYPTATVIYSWQDIRGGSTYPSVGYSLLEYVP